ncbi:Multidrug resistance-associated protein 1 [Dinochytrium kinnereticum]|nr:Multidrug resistance-associated protein 1 [Dinochytrium kinnereticum]
MNIATGGPSPEPTASILQRLLFTYFDPLLHLGFKRPLDSSDVWDLPPAIKSHAVGDEFEAIWEKEFKVARDKCADTGKEIKTFRPHLRALWKYIGRDVVWAAIPRVVGDCCQLAGPVALLYLIRYLNRINTDRESDNVWFGYVLALILFLLQVIQTFAFVLHNSACSRLGYKLRTALITVNFKKMLKLAPSARARLTSGKIINVIVSDTNRIDLSMQTFPNIYSAPFLILVASILLIINLGASAVIGLAVLILYLPCQNWIQKTMGSMRSKANKIADERIRITSEALSGIRVIKAYAWEPPFRDIVAGLRVIPALAMVATFIAYRHITSNLDAATVFSSLSLFYVLRSPLLMIPLTISQATDAWIAIERIEEVLTAEELTDGPQMLPPPKSDEPAVSIRDAEFIWSNASIPTPTQTPEVKEDVLLAPLGDGSFKLKVEKVDIAPGSLVAVIGTVGAGKSSFLQALVGEMKRTRGEVTVRGSLGWCPQQAWVLNQTVKGNILFGQEFDGGKYEDVVEKCALKTDLKILPAGDQTEIGERGINLSGGQKQRLSLSRAVYFGADVILLNPTSADSPTYTLSQDDPLSAVDAHVGRYLFENCIRGALHSKTRILVTHQLHFLPQVDRIIVLSQGSIVEDGTYDELMKIEKGFTRRMMEEFGGIEDEETGNGEGKKSAGGDRKEGGGEERKEERKKDDGKLMQTEERQVGVVTFGTLKEYIVQGGGLPMLFFVLFGALASQVARIMTDNWLAFWSSRRYDLANQVYEGVYVALGLSQAVFLVVFAFALVYAGLWSSQNMHILAVGRVLKAPVAFFDTTPLGRLITRFSRDGSFRTFLFTLTMTLTNFGLIAAIFPAFLGGLLPSVILFYFLQRYYSSSSREIRRLDSVTRSALFAHVSETLTGLATIRAYARQKMFIEQNRHLLDTNGRMYYVSVMIPIWLAIRLESISALLIFLASMFAVVYRYQTSPGLAGLTISYAISITGVFQWCVRQSAELEQNLNSVERLGYLIHDIPQERDVIGDDVVTSVPESWPQKGRIEFENVEMRYRDELPLVLKGISFSIEAGEKCGIVGRTGAGKSSILIALLRLVENSSGSVKIDGIDISTIPHARLRSSIAVIPQDPVLFSGTIRTNLDPFSEYSDDKIWKALEKSDLKQTVASFSLGLEAVVSENGDNFSTGQRQLLCLARAMLKSSKIILLDEATASVDLATDDFIQKAIRESFSDATVITIAHRLNTVADYSKILVLANGVVIEEGTPKTLLETSDGVFSKMVEETGSANASAIRGIAGVVTSP